jgi:hypothetical protein
VVVKCRFPQHVILSGTKWSEESLRAWPCN